MFLPAGDVLAVDVGIMIDDRAARSESAVDDSAPMIMMKNSTTRIVGRYDATICGMMLLTSPSIGSIPR